MTSNKPSPPNQGISIVIPTYKRPDCLKTALESVMHKKLKGHQLQIIVADNDPEASAQNIVAELAQHASVDIKYTHVPEPGVSNARNGALKIANGRYIAFLDDDMEATEDWLDELLKVADDHKAGICFGPVHAVMPDPENSLSQHMQAYFSRCSDSQEGLISEAFGTGGCLLDLAICQLPQPPFNPDLNEVGGEDDFLFQHLIQNGVKIGWAPKAVCLEHVPEHRVTEDYLWKRNFAFGQGPTQQEADKGWKGSLGIAKWMIIGAVQTLIFAPLYKCLKIVKHPVHVVYLAKTAQGLGKILWWDNFSPKLYGLAGQKHKEA